MSMRYADPTTLGVPAVPSLPSNIRLQEYDDVVRDQTSEVRESPWAADKKLLEGADFDPDACKGEVCHKNSTR